MSNPRLVRPSNHPPAAAEAGGVRPLVFVKGAGALSNPQGRFERDARTPFDDGWGLDDGPGPQAPISVAREVARSIISRNQSPDIPFDLSVNPYRGCEHGCIYCYARPNHAYVGLSPGLDFERRLFAKSNAAELLRQELAHAGYRCQPINIGSATDAYQPIERTWRLTRAVLEVLSACDHPLTIITKSALVERDVDLLAPMARRGLAAVYVTITTLDPALARIWEPRAAAPWRRLELVRRLSEAGIPVGVSIAPLVPFVNEHELEQIMTEARAAGASSAFYMMLRLPWELKDLFVDWLNVHFPDRARRVLARLGDLRGGAGAHRLNDPRYHTRMKGQGKWAELLRMRFDVASRRLGYGQGRVALRTDLFRPPGRDGQMALFPVSDVPSAGAR
ncbi:MAG TPA: PA0069 family radical SAM protein [Quisquiliibacterium sp.]|nr:PA0069 family radical SAM protein [Quisquiliibacterium sp.]